jgi:HEAT repeat protein
VRTPLSEAGRDSILRGLESPEGELRRLSVEQLPLLAGAEALPRIVEHLGDGDWRVRKAAVEAVRVFADEPDTHASLVAALADGENPGRRNSAFEALVACGQRVVARLVEELPSEDVDVRKLVVDALAAIADPASLPALIGAVDDSDPNVRAAVAEALGSTGGNEAIPPLLRMIERADEDLLVRLSALRALVRLEANVPVALLGPALDDPLLRAAALELAGYAQESGAVELLLKALASSNASSREAAIRALLAQWARRDGSEADALLARLREVAASDDRLVESTCERLGTADLCHRMAFVQFLGLLEDVRAVLPILEAGRDDALRELSDGTLERLGSVLAEGFEPVWEELQIDLKRRACRVLGRAGGGESQRLLAESLAGADPELRCEAALALGRGACFERIPELVRGLEVAARSEDPESRDEVTALIEAIVALAEHADAGVRSAESRLVEGLTGRLAGAPEAVRLAIARVLARVGRGEQAEIIGGLLRDESPAVRRAAVHALSRLESARTHESLRLALVDESPLVRTAAAQVLGGSSRLEALDDLRLLTADEDPDVVAVALRATGHLIREAGSSPDDAYGLIAAALEGAPIVALAACETLFEIGGRRAGELAAPALMRPEAEVLRAAVACLAAHGSLEDLDRLEPLISHPDWSVRADAVEVLAARGVRRCLPALLRRLDGEEDGFVREAILRATRRLEE